jgi:hypothetical protein
MASTGRQESCKTYIEQTKLLVTLASAFVAAPVALIPLLRGSGAALAGDALSPFFYSEAGFIGSILLGYLALGSVAGSQHKDEFDVYRPTTMWVSRVQIAAYLLGLYFFTQYGQILLNAAGDATDTSRLRLSSKIFQLVEPLPTFASGSAMETPPATTISDAVCRARSELARANGQSAFVVGRHDDQSLTPRALAAVMSNMNLARLRGRYVAQLLQDSAGCSAPAVKDVTVLAAGPVASAEGRSQGERRADDRRVTIFGVRVEASSLPGTSVSPSP